MVSEDDGRSWWCYGSEDDGRSFVDRYWLVCCTVSKWFQRRWFGELRLVRAVDVVNSLEWLHVGGDLKNGLGGVFVENFSFKLSLIF